jgi:hypothetical protein
MNVKNDISEELRSLSALVATISRETPYRAPEGYFLSFPTMALERVQGSLIKTAREVPRVAGLESNKPLTFSVPEGYFDNFAQQVLSRIKSGSGPSSTGTGEEETLSADFDKLPAILVQAGRITPYVVPEGYFDGLSPVLAVLKDKNPYIVPAGYFDGLATVIAARTADVGLRVVGEDHGRSKARVIGFGKRMSWMKYAAAAVVAGLVFTVSLLRWHSTTTSTQVAGTRQQPPVDIAKNLTRVSDEELQNFLVDQDTTLAQPVTNNASMVSLGMDDSDIKSLLGQVPDGDLKQYMEEHGGTNDIATN